MIEHSNGHVSQASPTILVVDDEVPIIKLCKALLEEAGFTVLEADGSSEALKICTQHQGGSTSYWQTSSYLHQGFNWLLLLTPSRM